MGSFGASEGRPGVDELRAKRTEIETIGAMVEARCVRDVGGAEEGEGVEGDEPSHGRGASSSDRKLRS